MKSFTKPDVAAAVRGSTFDTMSNGTSKLPDPNPLIRHRSYCEPTHETGAYTNEPEPGVSRPIEKQIPSASQVTHIAHLSLLELEVLLDEIAECQ
jgi:hypothetical protein